jgi:hypothetical protein
MASADAFDQEDLNSLLCSGVGRIQDDSARNYTRDTGGALSRGMRAKKPAKGSPCGQEKLVQPVISAKIRVQWFFSVMFPQVSYRLLLRK